MPEQDYLEVDKPIPGQALCVFHLFHLKRHSNNVSYSYLISL